MSSSLFLAQMKSNTQQKKAHITMYNVAETVYKKQHVSKTRTLVN